MMGVRRLSWGLLSLLLSSGCEEETEKRVKAKTASAETKEPEAPKEPESPPHLLIGESGPSVRGMSVMLSQPNGSPDVAGRDKLRTYLEEEAKFLKDQDLRVVVNRKAKPVWVSIFLSELSKHTPSKVTIATETRSDFPKEVEFAIEQLLDDPDPCTLVGTITHDRGTAIWRLKGGTARKRSRGMGGPDLSMTADTIENMAKGCDSDLFFVTGAEGVEWGLVYDLAASAVALDKVTLKRAVVPTQTATAGRKLKLTQL